MIDYQNVGRPPSELVSAATTALLDTRILRGAGSPEGVVTGFIGQVFQQTDATLASGVWTKMSGDGTMDGWRKLQLDNKEVNVLDHGAKADWDGTSGTDNLAAFMSAAEVVRYEGGTLRIPPGPYWLDGQWLLHHDQWVSWEVLAFGAELFTGPACTDKAIKVLSDGRGPHGTTWRGLKINHRGNTTATGLIELVMCHYANIDRLHTELHDVAPDWAGITLSSQTPGDPDTCCLWTNIEKFTMRRRSSTDGAKGSYGIVMAGGQNATTVRKSSIGDVDIGILMTNDGSPTDQSTIPNGIVIDDNAFEGVTYKAIHCIANDGGGYNPAGLRITKNRCERGDTFFSLTTIGGTRALEHSVPPFLDGNYCTNGSVTTWVDNPTGANINSLDASSYGPASLVRLQSQGPVTFPASGVQSNLILQNESGGSSWSAQHLQFGSGAGIAGHVWPDSSVGRLKFHPIAPTSSSDGLYIDMGGAENLAGVTIKATVIHSSLTTVGILASPHMTSPFIDSGDLTVTDGVVKILLGGVIFGGTSSRAAATDRFIAPAGSSTTLAYNVPTGGVHYFAVNATLIAQIQASGLFPSADNAVALGASGLRWTNAYAVNFVGALTGNASTATSAGKLTTARNINGVAFDGTADITISAVAAAGTLTGSTLAAGVTASSLTSVGSLTALTTGNITMSAAAARIIGGSTSLALRNNANSADNLLMTDAGVATFRSTVVTAASASGAAGLRLPHGTAPSSPVDGDVWTTSAGLYARINGTTIGPLT